jgi:hypothetical protein
MISLRNFERLKSSIKSDMFKTIKLHNEKENESRYDKYTMIGLIFKLEHNRDVLILRWADIINKDV